MNNKTVNLELTKDHFCEGCLYENIGVDPESMKFNEYIQSTFTEVNKIFILTLTEKAWDNGFEAGYEAAKRKG